MPGLEPAGRCSVYALLFPATEAPWKIHDAATEKIGKGSKQSKTEEKHMLR